MTFCYSAHIQHSLGAECTVGMTGFGANLGAGFAANTVSRVLDGHDHHDVIHFIIITFITEQIGFINQIKNIPGADLVTTSATNTGMGINCRNKFWGPTLAAGGQTGNHSA